MLYKRANSKVSELKIYLFKLTPLGSGRLFFGASEVEVIGSFGFVDIGGHESVQNP